MDLLPSVALVGLVLVLAGNLGSTNVELRAAVFRSSVTQALQSWDCSTLEHSRTSLRQGHQLLLDSRHRLPRLARSAEQLAREHPWDVDLAERGTSLYDEQEQHIFSACAAMRELLDQAWQLTAEPAAEAR